MSDPRRVDRHALIVDRARTRPWLLRDRTHVVQQDGWQLTVLTDRPQPEHWSIDDGSVTVEVVDELGWNSILESADQANSRRPLDAASTTSELFVEDVARLRERYDLDGPGVEYTQRMRDKWVMKRTASDACIAHTGGALASAPDARDLVSSAEHAIIKPRALSGSRGVEEVRTAAEFDRWLGSCEEPNDFIVEPFIAHPMLHIDGIAHCGEVVWQVSQYTTPTHQSGLGAPLSSFTLDDPALRASTGTFVCDVVSGWQIENDVFHLEAFATDQGLVFCEIAGRPGGAGVSDVFVSTRGLDLHRSKTRLDLGEVPVAEREASDLAAHGGWMVFYGAAGSIIHDEHLTGHETRSIRLDRAAGGGQQFSGVGIATYTFAGHSSKDIRDKIARYGEGVRIERI